MSGVCKEIAISKKEETEICFNTIKPQLLKLKNNIVNLCKHSSEICAEFNSIEELSKEENIKNSYVLEILDRYHKIDRSSFKLIRKILIEKKGCLMDLKVISSFLSFIFILGRISRRVCRIYEFLEDLKVSYFLDIANF